MPILTSPCAPALKDYVSGESCDANPPAPPPDSRLVQQCTFAPRPPLPPDDQLERDRRTLCVIMCCCDQNPSLLTQNGEASGRQKQRCVESTLKQTDSDLDGQSRFRPEVRYDMRKHPPEPYRWWFVKHSLGPEDMPHPAQPYILGPEDKTTRIPDVVIVRDPTRPPYGENIVRVVEMKFPGDELHERQRDDYERIASYGGGAEVMYLEKCRCNDKKEVYESHLEAYKARFWETFKKYLKQLGSLPPPVMPPGRRRIPPLRFGF